MKVLMSNDPAMLTEALVGMASATVEAEYGATLVEGSVLTLAHHGPRSGNPAPCLEQNGVTQGVEVIGASHLDLDALGGILAVMGVKPDAHGFWNVAAFCDVKGPHMIPKSGAAQEDILRLQAYWAWSASHRVSTPQGAYLVDITQEVEESRKAVIRILGDDPELIQAGIDFVRESDLRASKTLVAEKNGILKRKGEGFNNTAYRYDGGVGVAIAALNVNSEKGTEMLTLSFMEEVPGVSADTIVKALWGMEAGGRTTIGGAPRNNTWTLEEKEVELERLFQATVLSMANPGLSVEELASLINF